MQYFLWTCICIRVNRYGNWLECHDDRVMILSCPHCAYFTRAILFGWQYNPEANSIMRNPMSECRMQSVREKRRKLTVNTIRCGENNHNRISKLNWHTFILTRRPQPIKYECICSNVSISVDHKIVSFFWCLSHYNIKNITRAVAHWAEERRKKNVSNVFN